MSLVKIFTEAGSGYGLGHLRRCQKIQKILTHFSPKIYIRGDLRDSQEWFENFKQLVKNSQTIIIDSYQANEEIYQIAQKNSKVLIILDDYNRLKYPTKSIILNPALGAENLYKKSSENLLGIRFAPVDNDFFYERKNNKKIKKILIAFGGYDKDNHTAKALDLLKTQDYDFDVILGPSYPHEIPKIGNIYQNISLKQISNLMQNNDIAITASGSILVELAQSKLPALILSTALNQEFQSFQWHNSGGMKRTTLLDLKKDLEEISPVSIRNAMIENYKKIQIGDLLPQRLFEIISKAV